MRRYSRVFKYIGQNRKEIFLYCLFIVLSILFSIISLGMLMPFLDLIFKDATPLATKPTNPVMRSLQNILNSLISGNSKVEALGIVCLVIITSILLKNFFLVLSFYILNPLKNKVINQLRTELFQKILQLPIGYFTEQKKGDIISRVTNDVGEVEVSVVGTLEGWIRDPLTIIFNFTVLFLISPQLTGFLLLFIPVVGWIIGRISRSLKKQSAELSQHNAAVMSVLDETLSGLRVIKAFTAETLIKNRFLAINAQLISAKNKMAYKKDLASPMSEFLGVVVFCCILYFGGRLVLSGGIALEAAAFIGYLALFYNIINPAKSLSSSFSNMQRGSAAIARIEEVLGTANTVDDIKGGRKLTHFNHSIELRNVSFAYNGIDVLKGINLTIEKGKNIALVGSSGAGKSTLADLIPRFHDVTEGELLIDGTNIKEFALHSVREQISIVTQEPILFNNTIASNILLGKPEATDEEVTEAARVANAHDFIIKKEEDYSTVVGDRGTKLSGGERQRLTIARAVLKNSPILILDEATSSLDTESERLVQDAINKMMQHRTSIVIAHRLSTIRHADEIIVLQKGEIVERGNHDELLLKRGYYYKLVQMQEVK